MENKGLNIFNTSACWPTPTPPPTPTTSGIESVVAPRVLPQLDRRPHHLPRLVPAVPEGRPDRLPRPGVLGRQCAARAVQRIEDVRRLRARQFPEDAGPAWRIRCARPATRDRQLLHRHGLREGRGGRAHACRRCSGRDGFRARHGPLFRAPRRPGRHLDAFVAAMPDATGGDLAQFFALVRRRPARRRSRPRTATTRRRGRYDARRSASRPPPTPGQPDKLPLPDPARARPAGRGRTRPAAASRRATRRPRRGRTSACWCSTEPRQTLRLRRTWPRAPVLSLLRGFSAPVKLRCRRRATPQLLRLLAHDSDLFNRWEAGQALAPRILSSRGAAARRGRGRADDGAAGFSRPSAAPFRRPKDPAFEAECAALPSESYIAEQMDVADPDAIHACAHGPHARGGTRTARDSQGRSGISRCSGPYSPDAAAAGGGRCATPRLALREHRGRRRGRARSRSSNSAAPRT